MSCCVFIGEFSVSNEVVSWVAETGRLRKCPPKNCGVNQGLAPKDQSVGMRSFCCAFLAAAAIFNVVLCQIRVEQELQVRNSRSKLRTVARL